MKRMWLKGMLALAVVAGASAVSGPAMAAQFSYLDPGYTQEIYTGPTPTAGLSPPPASACASSTTNSTYS